MSEISQALNLRSHYSYHLDDERIAKQPLGERDAAKLLVYDIGQDRIVDRHVKDLPELLAPSSLIILNTSKVIPARLVFRKESGAGVELFLLEPREPEEYTVALAHTTSCTWNCLIGGKNVRVDSTLRSADIDQILQATILTREENRAEVRFEWNTAQTFAEVIALIGSSPLPPYIKREETADDRMRYQTVFAREEGSVAAPTAGLHLSSELLEHLDNASVRRGDLCLHVGLGTFLPMKSEDVSDHHMHAELITIPSRTISALHTQIVAEQENAVVCVGTTSLRSIESLYWLAYTFRNQEVSGLSAVPLVEQWVWKQLAQDAKSFSPAQALLFLLEAMNGLGLDSLRFRTKLMIAPGYDFKFCTSLMTNFHQPESTLLVLVSAFCGDAHRKKLYEHALENDYRFLSYGDSSLLVRSQKVAQSH